MLSSVSDLLTYIDEQQLTPELGGTLEYCHSEWVVFRTVSAGWARAPSPGAPWARLSVRQGVLGSGIHPQSHCPSWSSAKQPRAVRLGGSAGELGD